LPRSTSSKTKRRQGDQDRGGADAFQGRPPSGSAISER
jgi:hypothetical protein